MNEQGSVNGMLGFYKRQGCLGKALIMTVLSVLFMCICSFPITLVSRLSQNLPQSVQGVEATIAPTISIPTKTPLPKFTATTKPTATAKPTNTVVVSTMNQDLEAYKAYIFERIDPCLESMGQMEDHSRNLGRNVELLYDEDWRTAVSMSLAGIELYCGTVGDYASVPEEFEEMNFYLKKFGDEMLLSSKLYEEGLDKIDPDKLDEASLHLTKAGAYMTKAGEIIKNK